MGGRLVVDDGRLAFTPHALDRKTGGRSFDVPLPEIVHIGKSERGANPFSGAWRRLVVHLANGSEVSFVVSKVDQRIEMLTESVRAAGGRPS